MLAGHVLHNLHFKFKYLVNYLMSLSPLIENLMAVFHDYLIILSIFKVTRPKPS
jgi:hypothetical protein